jgi:hypothetical protein
MSEEKKWKRGDIGPDGMVFWQYGKSYKNGERWIDADRFKERQKKQLERSCRYKKENREKVEEDARRYYQENREKVTEARRRYCQENREKVEEDARRYYQENREKMAEDARRYYQENREKGIEASRRRKLKKTLQKSTPKTLHQFYALLTKPRLTLAAIFLLSPDEGQTLAELIHELSGYPMELCEQIANPPDPEPETEPTPEPTPPPAILPDLF